MITEQEARHLLAVAMAYDNRKPGDSAVLAWLKAAELGRWTFDSAREAIHAHYAVSTEYVMPAHITHRIRIMREEAASRALDTAPAEPDPEAAARHQRIVDYAMGWTRDHGDMGALDVECPHCRVGPNARCVRWSAGRNVPCDFHPSRLEAVRRRAS